MLRSGELEGERREERVEGVLGPWRIPAGGVRALRERLYAEAAETTVALSPGETLADAVPEAPRMPPGERTADTPSETKTGGLPLRVAGAMNPGENATTCVNRPMRSCGSDDFGFYGRLAPTLMVFVGLGGAPGIGRFPLHHPRFLPPPEAVEAIARAQAVALATASTN